LATGAAHADSIGDRLGIFCYFTWTQEEFVLWTDDRHLDVRVSIVKLFRGDRPCHAASTMADARMLLGRIDRAPVGRVHPSLFGCRWVGRRSEIFALAGRIGAVRVVKG
jgi:hypothetical protein